MKRGGPTHPKIAELATILNIDRAWAVGIVEMLWHFTAQFAPQGDIGKYSDKKIADFIGWKKHSGSRGVTSELWLSSALVRSGLVDCCDCHRLVVHDWAEHADQSVIRKLTRQKLAFVHPITSRRQAVPEPEPEPIQSSSSSEISTPVGNHNTQAAAPSALLPATTTGDLAALLDVFREFGRGCSDRDLTNCQRLWAKLTDAERHAAASDIHASLSSWRGRPTEKIPQPWNYLEGRYWERNINRKQPKQEMGKWERGFREAAAEFHREHSTGGKS